jgi:predicted DNA-binding WGR domain protein
MTSFELQCIDLARNVWRFYRLDVQPDLCGGFLLSRQFGRIGPHGRALADMGRGALPDALARPGILRRPFERPAV